MKKTLTALACTLLLSAPAFAEYIVVLKTGTRYTATEKWTVVNGKAIVKLRNGQSLQLDPALIDVAKSEQLTKLGMANANVIDLNAKTPARQGQQQPSLGSQIRLRRPGQQQPAQEPVAPKPSATPAVTGGTGVMSSQVIDKFQRAYENVGIFEHKVEGNGGRGLLLRLIAAQLDRVAEGRGLRALLIGGRGRVEVDHVRVGHADLRELLGGRHVDQRRVELQRLPVLELHDGAALHHRPFRLGLIARAVLQHDDVFRERRDGHEGGEDEKEGFSHRELRNLRVERSIILTAAKRRSTENISMLVVMEAAARPDQIEAVVRQIERMGFRAHPIPGASRTAIGVTGHGGKANPQILENLPGVKEVIPVSHAYKLVSREARPDDSVINVGGVDVGGKGVVVIGGPCAVESLDQTRTIAERIKRAGGQLFRGGAYKPRTSPYSFQGLGEQALEILARVREEFDIPVVTEAVDKESLQLVDQYADCIQIGARNMQNFSLLKDAGRARKPVLLKRGMSATLEELLLSAEYIMSEGNYKVMLCERGVRTFADHTRNTLDLSVIPAIKRISHLPILVDPSHGTGKRNKVLPMSRAAIAAGADGVLIEVHHKPEEALSDGPQALLPEAFEEVVRQVDAIAQVLGRTLQPALAAR